MKKFSVRMIAIVVLTVSLATSGAVAATAAPPDDVVGLINSQRASAGLPALVRDSKLDAAAQEWAQTMSTSRNFTHSGAEWRAARIPSGWSSSGENIAYGYRDGASVMNAWMASKGHKENILRSSYTHVGVGYVASGNYWVQIFAGYSPSKAPSKPPTGSLDEATSTVSATAAEIRLRGWALDPQQATTPISVHTWVVSPGGARTRYITAANTSRPDVGRAFPGAGDSHGFTSTIPVTKSGTYQACSNAVSTLPGGSTTITAIGCRSVVVGPSRPAGSLDSASIGLVDSKPVLSLRGWAFDNVIRSASTVVHVYVTTPSGRTTSQAVAATNARNDVGAAFPGAGAAHGFETSIPISEVGTYRVCVYAIGVGVFADSNTALYCGPVAFGPTAPTGVVDSAVTSGEAIKVTGWAMDNALRSAVNEAHVYVTSPTGATRGYIAVADDARPDVEKAFPGAGAAHGFSIDVPATSVGTYRVCTYSISAPQLGDGNVPLPCRTVNVSD